MVGILGKNTTILKMVAILNVNIENGFLDPVNLLTDVLQSKFGQILYPKYLIFTKCGHNEFGNHLENGSQKNSYIDFIFLCLTSFISMYTMHSLSKIPRNYIRTLTIGILPHTLSTSSILFQRS